MKNAKMLYGFPGLACLMAFLMWGSTPAGAQEKSRSETSDSAEHRVQQVRDLLARANEHARLTSWGSAIELYQEVLKIFPDYSPAWFEIGVCYEGMKDTGKAVEQYRLITQTKDAPADLVRDARIRVEALLIPHLIEAQAETYKLARALLHRAAQRKSKADDDPSASDNYEKPLSEAIDRLESLRGGAPDYTPLYLDLGQAYELAGRKETASRTFDEYLMRYAKLGIPLGPEQHDVRVRKSFLALDETARPPQLSVQQAIRVYNDGLDCEICGEYEQAIDRYEKVLHDYPENHQARYRLGVSLLAKGRSATGIEQLRLATRGRNVSRTLIEEICELVEKASCPTLSPEQERTLATAIARYNAAQAILMRGHLIVDASWTTDYSNYDVRRMQVAARANSLILMVRDLISEAIAGLEQFIAKHPKHIPSYVNLAKSYHLDMETKPGLAVEKSAVKVRELYDQYLKWYLTLGLPMSQKYAEVVSRRAEVERDWPR